jgi:hypothetical protein
MIAPVQEKVAAYGDYRFGMSREDVKRVASCAPYQAVAGTGGLECSNLIVGARKITISFVFTADALTRIQLWFYEGQSESAARAATTDMLAFLSKLGPIHSNEVAGGVPAAESIFKSIRQRNTGQGARVQVLLPPASKPPYVHGSVTQVATGYYVFVFFSASARSSPGKP